MRSARPGSFEWTGGSVGRENLEDWREILPQVVHIHGKFYDIHETGTSPSIDYERILRIFADAPQPITMSSEWEGHAYLDADEQDAFQMVARHHAVCRRLMGSGRLACS